MKKLMLSIVLPLLVILITPYLSFGKTDKLDKDFILVAHRGGVVDENTSENSIKGLEEAIKRGYTHIEIDARVSKDGHVICFHDENLKRETGIDKNISDLTLEEIKKIKLLRSEEQIPTFHEYCQKCQGRINVMVDTKGVSDKYVERYCREIETALADNGLLKDALFIINIVPIHNQEKVAYWFVGKSKVCWRVSLEKAKILLNTMPKDIGKYYYIFNYPRHFTKDDIQGFHEMGLKVVLSVNLSHYKTGDPQQQGLDDICKALDMGVDGLQIDSCYDPIILPLLAK